MHQAPGNSPTFNIEGDPGVTQRDKSLCVLLVMSHRSLQSDKKHPSSQLDFLFYKRLFGWTKVGLTSSILVPR